MVGLGPRQGFKVAPKSAADIAAAAAGVRATLGVRGYRFDAGRTLESLTKYGVTVDVVADNDRELPHGVEACWVPDTVTMIIRESVYVAACNSEPRALFTIAHELGHLALAHRRTFNRQTGAVCKMYEDSEWQANTFAAEFLMPVELIRQAKVTHPAQIEVLFGVSAKAAETRFNKLKGKNAI